MGRLVHFLITGVLLFSVTSCIMDDIEECPPEYTIKVSIKDKNYANIAEVTQLQPLDENLPLSGYISNLYYSLLDLSTGKIYMESQLLTLTGTDKAYTINFNNVPDGNYKLAVWGNLDPGIVAGNLHNNENESTDLYLGSTNLTFSSGHHEGSIELERSKGKLLVLCSNFPSDIVEIEQKISNIYSMVDANKNYSGSTSVNKVFNSDTMLETFLAPTIDQMKSTLKLKFKKENSPVDDLIVPGIDLIINRGEITVVSVNYNDLIGEWEISALIDGQWTLIHQFKINEI